MGFISFLKEFGLIALKGIQIFEGIEPTVKAAAAAAGVPTTGLTKLDTVTGMVASALDIEQTFVSAFGPDNKGGIAKLQALIPKVQQIVADAQVMTGKQVGDPVLFAKAMQEYAQASVDLANSLKPAVKTSDAQNLPSPPVTPQPLPPPVPAAPGS